MDINSTLIQSYSSSQLISWAHQQTAIPSLLILFISTFLIFLLVGLVVVNNKGKFFTIWGSSFVLSGIVLILLIYLPNTVQAIKDFFVNFFTF